MTIRNLHDAVFEELLVRWKEGVAIITVRTQEGRSKLLVRNITAVHLPRRMPWGPSDHVHSFTQADTEAGVRIEVELQSGDSLLIEGASLAEVDATSDAGEKDL